MGEFALKQSPYGKFLLPTWCGDVARWIADDRFWDEFLKPYFDKYTNQDASAIDIGTNIGILNPVIRRVLLRGIMPIKTE